MTFTYDNIEYRIGFSQITESNNIPGIGIKDQRSTIARIRTGERNTKTEVLVGEGKVTHYYKDKFSFEGGRKNALSVALDACKSLWFDKAFRTAAWTAYHSRQGGILSRKKECCAPDRMMVS